MNKNFTKVAQIVLIVLLFSFTTSNITAPSWNIDKNHSKISFEVNHFFTPVVGFFNEYEGELNFDPNDLESSRANFTIQVASVKTDSDKRDKHLQSGDFFDVEKYPTMKFTSNNITKTENGYVINGELTIRDVKKIIDLPFKVLGIGDHPMKKANKIVALKGSIKINRNEYGVGSGSWAATAVVGDEVIITVVLEATRKV
jgi:polyisoprenoid-binding protein YceI